MNTATPTGNGRFVFPGQTVAMKRWGGKWVDGGTVVWPYRHLTCTADIIGRGTFASVFAGVRNGGEPVAIKVHRIKYGSTARSEANVLKQLDHPNVCEHLDSFRSTNGHLPSTFVLVMPRYHDTLYNAITRCCDLGECVPHQDAIVSGLLDGVEYLDAKGIVHMDIKPANIALREDSSPVIIDWNTFYDISTPEKELSLMRQHPMGPYRITRYYRTPELLIGCSWLPRAQMMWTVAVLAFEMADGHSPWPGKDGLHTLQLIEHALKPFHGTIPKTMLSHKLPESTVSRPVPRCPDQPFYTVPRPMLDILLFNVLLWDGADRASATEVKELFAETTEMVVEGVQPDGGLHSPGAPYAERGVDCQNL